MLSLFFAISTSVSTSKTTAHFAVTTSKFHLKNSFTSSSEASEAYSTFFFSKELLKQINKAMTEGKTKYEFPLDSYTVNYKNNLLKISVCYGGFTYTNNNDGTFTLESKIRTVEGKDALITKLGKNTIPSALESTDIDNLIKRMNPKMEEAKKELAPFKFE